MTGSGDCRRELRSGEGTVEANFNNADLFALGGEVIDGLLNRVVDAAHGDDDDFRIRRTIVIEELVVRTNLGIDLIHVLLDNPRHLRIGRVTGFSCLEEDIRILRGAHFLGMGGV